MKPYARLMEPGHSPFPEQALQLQMRNGMLAFGTALEQQTMSTSFSRSSSATPEIAWLRTSAYAECSPTALTPPLSPGAQSGNFDPTLKVASTCTSNSASTQHRRSYSATPEVAWLRTFSSEEYSPSALTPPLLPGGKYGHIASYLKVASTFASKSASTPHTPQVISEPIVNLSDVCIKLQQLIDDRFQEENQQTPIADAISETRETAKVDSSAS